MARRHAPRLLVVVLLGALAAPAGAGDAPVPPKGRVVVDPVKAKAQETEKLRLLAKLHADAPKVVESHHGANPLDAPIFHRYDRPAGAAPGSAMRSPRQ